MNKLLIAGVVASAIALAPMPHANASGFCSYDNPVPPPGAICTLIGNGTGNYAPGQFGNSINGQWCYIRPVPNVNARCSTVFGGQ